MPLDILGMIAADAAGESMQKSKEKKKLEAAKDNPEEHARVLEEIEKRKERNNKVTLYLIGLILIILFFQSAPTLGVFVAISFTFYALIKEKTSPPDEEAEGRTDSKTSSGTISPSERQALMSRKCSVPGCNTGNFRMTDYCHKHQDHISSNSEPKTEEEENWWDVEADNTEDS